MIQPIASAFSGLGWSFILWLAMSVLLQGCAAAPSPPTPLPTVTPTLMPTPASTATPAAPATGGQPELYTYKVVAVLPHDPAAFTQGLIYTDGVFYEGTGLQGTSWLRKVDPATGAVLQQHDLAQEYHGEGITLLNDRIYQLTWKSNTGFVYDRDTFAPLQQFAYPTEGWGITHDGTRLIVSDGTPYLYFWDPATLQETGRIVVTYMGEPLGQLNELEYVDGAILANVWKSEVIVRIDPASGVVTGVLDMRGLLQAGPPVTGNVDVLNGIAYDAEGDRLFVTGKYWPAIFEIELVRVDN
jgi:glutaminyl-peptide cyclotransferase